MSARNSYALRQSKAITRNHKSLWKITVIGNERIILYIPI